MAPTLNSISATSGHFVGQHQNFIFLRWINEYSVDAVNALDKAFARAPGNEKLAWLTVMEGAMAKHQVSRDVRVAIAKTLNSYGNRIAGAAVAIEGDPMATAAIRGVVTSVDMLVPTSYPSNVFNDTGSACDWLAGLLTEAGATPLPSKTMAGLVREVRSKK